MIPRYLLSFYQIYFVIFTGLCLTIAYETRNDFRRLNETEFKELQQICGINKIKDESKNRITFGNKAKCGQFPWAAQLNRKSANGFTGKCSASIISHYHVITAAHCLDYKTTTVHIKRKTKNYRRLTNFNVQEGLLLSAATPCIQPDDVNVTEVNEGNMKPLKLRVKRVIVPRSSVLCNFNDMRKQNQFSDIAIIELNESLPINNDFIKPICIPNRFIEVPKYPTFYGYGVTEIEGKGTRVLNWFTHHGDTMDENICKKILSLTRAKFNKYCESVIAIFYENGDPTTTGPGDSGGGLSGNENGREYLFGVNSLGKSYYRNPTIVNDEVYYTVLNKVSKFHDFICYYTGICPNGYNQYYDKYYEQHPEPVAVLSDGKGKELIEIGDLAKPKRHRQI